MTQFPLYLDLSNSPTDQLAAFAVLRVNDVNEGSDEKQRLPIRDLHECSFKWCAQTFSNVSVVNASTTSARPSKTWTLKTWKPKNAHPDILIPVGYWSRVMPGYAADHVLTYAVLAVQGDTDHQVSNATFTINANDFEAISDYLQVVLTSSRTDPPEGVGASLDISEPLLAAQSVPDLMSNVAISMTNNIRMNGNSSLNGRTLPNTANGTAFQTVTFVRVRWAWLSLPALVIVTGSFVLLAAIVQAGIWPRKTPGGSQPPLWRDSNVGLLYHGLGSMHGQDTDAAALWEENSAITSAKTATRQSVKDRAREIRFSLEQGDDGKMRFVPLRDQGKGIGPST
ncbi:MAG: hypothetical protein M1828_006664 [Chrysothrix sp. TS-e1954]|nr:MAG: hypothetical protein M1828_006664 [Chrysothrix sp. TS-e1954]